MITFWTGLVVGYIAGKYFGDGVSTLLKAVWTKIRSR